MEKQYLTHEDVEKIKRRWGVDVAVQRRAHSRHGVHVTLKEILETLDPDIVKFLVAAEEERTLHEK
jgi:hypothetical protein